MASSTPLCGICDSCHVSKPAVVWCSECDEGFCTDCSDHHTNAKISKHHTTISIDKYLKLPQHILQIEQFCKEHDEKFTHFCKEHDCPCCITCILNNHKQCRGNAKMDDVVQNVKSSHAFQETEQILVELADNIQKIKKDRRQNVATLESKKVQIEKEINEFRVEVNDHLDKLQHDIIKELNKAEETERKAIQEIISDLDKREKYIGELQMNLTNIKQYASDIQAYLCMKKIQDDVSQTDSAVDLLINGDSIQQKGLFLDINAAMKDILARIDKFGNVVVEVKSSNVVVTKKKHQQAPLLVPLQPRTIDDIILQLKQKINVDSNDIRGCCTLPDGRLVFTDFNKRTLIFMNTDGTHNTTLIISFKPFDVIYVKHNNSLAVSSGPCDQNNKCIKFINITSNNVKETIELDSECYGMAVKDHTLFFCTKDSIMSLNLKDKSITKFKDVKQADSSYIDIFENNIYHTNRPTDTITCYDLSGKVQWEFKDENTYQSIVYAPRDISVDNRGNVYVAGCSNVVVISPDGQKCRELLSPCTQDKLSDPSAIHYDRFTENLLVANSSDTSFLYKVT